MVSSVHVFLNVLYASFRRVFAGNCEIDTHFQTAIVMGLFDSFLLFRIRMSSVLANPDMLELDHGQPA